MPTVPRPRYGWTPSVPADYGEAYERVGVVPGDRVTIRHYGEGTVISPEDPDLQAGEDWIDPPAIGDGYVYVDPDSGAMDGYPPGTITKL